MAFITFLGWHKVEYSDADEDSQMMPFLIIAIVRITFCFIRRIISLRSARTRKQKRVKENMSMAF